MNLKNKRIFISGAAGVIGKQLVKILEKEGCQIFAGDKKNRPEEFSKRTFYRQGDLNTIKLHEINSYECEIFIHLAAAFERTHESFPFYDQNFQDNLALSNKLLKLFSNTKKIKKILFASSYLIYDKKLYLKKNLNYPISLNENSKIDTRNLIGTTKYFHEKEIEFFKKFKKKIKFHSIRIFRGYGLGSRDIISRWIRLALENKKINLYNKESSFDFIFSIDTARGIFQILKKYPDDLYINLGSGNSVKIRDVISELKLNFKNLKIIESRSDKLVERSVSSNKIMKQIGWAPKYSISNGIKKIIQHEKTNLKKNKRFTEEKILITCFGEKKISWLKHFISAKNRINKNLEIVLGNSNKNSFIKSIYKKIVLMPKIQDYTYEKMLYFLKQEKIRTVLPTNNDELLFWSKNKKIFIKIKLT